jgi:hypothetical protein
MNVSQLVIASSALQDSEAYPVFVKRIIFKGLGLILAADERL